MGQSRLPQQIGGLAGHDDAVVVGEPPMPVQLAVRLLKVDDADIVAASFEPRPHLGALLAVERLIDGMAPVEAPFDRHGGPAGEVGQHAIGAFDRPRKLSGQRRRLDVEGGKAPLLGVLGQRGDVVEKLRIARRHGRFVLGFVRAHGAERSADPAGSHIGGQVDGVSEPQHGCLSALCRGVKKLVVGVMRQPDEGAVQGNAFGLTGLPYPRGQRRFQFRRPPGVDQVEAELHQVEAEVLPHYAGPGFGLDPALDRERQVGSELHGGRFLVSDAGALLDRAHGQAAHELL